MCIRDSHGFSQFRLPIETQQTPNKAPKRLQPGLNLDTSFGDPNWRALLEGPWIYLILPVKTQNSTQFSELFLSKSKFDLKKYDK